MIEHVADARYSVEGARLKFFYMKRKVIPPYAGSLSFSLNFDLASYWHITLGLLQSVLLDDCC